MSSTPSRGTGTFLTRLIQDEELLPEKALARKYHYELHANEIMLLAYYISWVNIAEALASRNMLPEPCPGLVWTDTFQDAERELAREVVGGQFDQTRGVSAANTEQIQRQLETPITVIVGNPPYRAGQKSGDEDNPNVEYKLLEKSITDTYAARTVVSFKRSLYDHYKLAIRWATDRISKQGIIAFVSNASYIDSNVDSGLRACIGDEFAAAWIFNLRGNQRTQGELSRQEGGKVFGSGSRAPIALSVLIKDVKYEGPCAIHYHQVDDYLTREDKLDLVERLASVESIQWKQIIPDSQFNWLNQRSEEFDSFLPVGN